MLAALAGVKPGAVVERMHRTLRLQILKILRPAEAAVRRLVFVVAQELAVKPAVVRAPANFRALRSDHKTAGGSRPAFQLSDPRPPMIVQYQEAFFKPSGVVFSPKRLPRVRFIPPIDPTIPALWASQRVREPRPDPETVRTQSILRRLKAITLALNDLPKQARRLQRWMQRRKRIFQSRLVYTSPLRAGPPPGARKEPEHEVDRILAECHLRAFEARWTGPRSDTS
jgi:hypothetical protein